MAEFKGWALLKKSEFNISDLCFLSCVPRIFQSRPQSGLCVLYLRA